MLWGERVSCRGALIGLSVVLALTVGIGFVILSRPSIGAGGSSSLALHPVAGSFVPDDTRLTECVDEGCFQQAFGNVAFRSGASAALPLVEKVYGSGASGACHRVTHAIGSATLARNGGNVAKTFSEGDSLCGSGFYHGVLERSLVRVQSRKPDRLAPVARTLCADAADITPWVEYQCLHGLGHGLMIATGLNLPISLEVCRRLRRWWDRDACRGGVFMENISTSYGVQSLFLKDDDPIYPCNWVRRSAKRRCYQTVTFRVLGMVRWDFERAAETCSVVETAYVHMCFQSLGKDVSTWSEREAERTVENCAVARRFGYEAECIYGAAQDAAANFADGQRAKPLCELVAGRLAARCFEGIGSVTGRFYRTVEERLNACRAVASSPVLIEACMRGGRRALPRA
jgi:hypothetical protein